MEISEYDEYVPEKELDKNFKIPRKRTAEDSFGAQASDAYAEYYAQAAQIRAAQAAQYAQYANSQVQNPQRQFIQAQALTGQGHYASLSGAASQATTHSNAKPPVRYPVKQVNTNIPPPPITPANNSLNVARQRNPNSNVSPSYSTSGNEYRSFTGSGNSGFSSANTGGTAANKNWGDGARRGTWNEAQNRNWNSGGGNNMGNYNRNQNDNLGVGNRNPGAGMNRSWNGNSNNSDNRNKNWGDERQNRNWGSGNFGGGDSEWNRRNFGSDNNWNSNSGNDFGNDDGFDETNDFPGDARKGSFAGMENNGNNRFGVNEPGFGDGYNDNVRFGYGNRQQWDLKADQGFGNGRGASGGLGRGGFNESEIDTRPGGFRGGRGRGYGGNFSFNTDRSNQMNNPRPYQRKEKPKMRQEYLAPIVPPDVNDETLPKELRSMFQPLYCKLCSLQMSSNIMAKMHYKSKNHEKKIRKYLIEEAEKTGEPVHARASANILQEKKEKEEDTDPKYFHCDICDLQLTGKLHAESHYMGKNHNAVVMGKKRPTGKGFYNAEGKWVRKTETKQTLPEGEDNFGLAFRKTSENTDSNDATASAEKPLAGKFTCSICNVSCTCQEQIDMHFSGSKHKKKLKHLGICPENFEVPKETDNESVTGEDSDLQLDPTEAADVKRNDFSRYKTPSGFYYCQKCNLTSNSEIQMKQHLTSKNHIRPKKEKKESEQPKEKPTE